MLHNLSDRERRSINTSLHLSTTNNTSKDIPFHSHTQTHTHTHANTHTKDTTNRLNVETIWLPYFVRQSHTHSTMTKHINNVTDQTFWKVGGGTLTDITTHDNDPGPQIPLYSVGMLRVESMFIFMNTPGVVSIQSGPYSDLSITLNFTQQILSFTCRFKVFFE
jgi:hypothetical protein